jgi:hypothetical protein
VAKKQQGKKQRRVKRTDLARMSFTNSPRIPKTVNDGGRSKRWVGIGWVDEGPATGKEEAVVID